MNKLFAIGRLTADPTQTQVNGVTCINFTLAADTRLKDKNGETVTNFYRVAAWRGLGETCAKFLHKGDKVNVVGDLVYQTYTDKNGQPRSQMQLTATDVEFLQPKAKPAGEEAPTAHNPSAAAPMPIDEGDDLPF